MKMRTLNIAALLVITILVACAQQTNTPSVDKEEEVNVVAESPDYEPHRYGGWYCPDNLFGFPAVDIANWKKVPVVNGRMPTKEETQNGTSLIFVDAELYPNAEPLDMEMPKLATIFNNSSQREEVIIIIQAVNVSNDSIVGFRYLNGGNGSARLNEVKFISAGDSKIDSKSKFVSESIVINATQVEVWETITNKDIVEKFNPIINGNNQLAKDWRAETNVNFSYKNAGEPTALYGDLLYGCYYIQNDYTNNSYTEKFLMIENQEEGTTELKMVCGPLIDDYSDLKNTVTNWLNKVKSICENTNG